MMLQVKNGIQQNKKTPVKTILPVAIVAIIYTFKEIHSFPAATTQKNLVNGSIYVVRGGLKELFFTKSKCFY